MEEETTTNVPVDEGAVENVQGVPIDSEGRAIAQPEEAETTEAVEETTEQVQDESTEEEQAQDSKANESVDNSDDFDYEAWLEKKGIDPTTPEGKKAIAKSWRGMEQKMHQSTTKAGEVERTMRELSDQSAQAYAEANNIDAQLYKRVQAIEVDNTVRNFFVENPEATKYDTEMMEYITTSGIVGTADKLLQAAYDHVRVKNLDAVKNSGKKEALQSLAQKQQAAVPRGNAVTSTSADAAITPQNVDRLVATHDLNWFRAHYDEINKAMAG